MLKPLIRTIPNLSGNVKIACTLSDFKKIDDKFECHVRHARLLPLSTTLAQKECDVNLLNSTYEFDLKKYYKLYSNIFFDTEYKYSKEIYGDALTGEELNNRDKDFEFGLKRISVGKNGGAQYAFFAPIWIENENDIPDYFLIHISIGKGIYNINKTIKININDYKKEDKYNYLNVYLNKYAKKLNTNVIFCSPSDNQATIYGIDLENGGFVKKIDNLIAKNYRLQSSINKFDLNITESFKRNKLCIKQVIPLCFLFSLEDILTEYEISKYGCAKLNIFGEYYKDNSSVKMYDFSTDYTSLKQKSWLIKNDKFSIQDTKKNIMNLPFPSLMEASYDQYEHFNKIQKEAVRWKLKYSSDDYPYITNMSPAFSMAQESFAKYREYPASFNRINIYDDYENNIISPLYQNAFYDKNQNIIEKYKLIMQNNASNWFNIIDYIENYERKTIYNSYELNTLDDWYFKVDPEDINSYINVSYHSDIAHLNDSQFENVTLTNTFSGNLYVKYSNEDLEYIKEYLDDNETNYKVVYKKNTIFNNKENWSNVIDNKVYFKGILYDLSSIYEKYPNLLRIDKFGVFVDPNIERIDSNKLNEIKTAKIAILTDKKYAKHLNAVQSTHLKELLSTDSVSSPIFMSESSIGRRMNEASHDSLFFENTSQVDGDFIDLNKLGYDYYELNKYYEIKELKRKYSQLTNILSYKKDKNIINGYYQIPIYRLSQVVFDKKTLWFENDYSGNYTWLKSLLFFSLRDNQNKSKYDKKTLSKLIDKYYNDLLEVPILVNSEFISDYTLNKIISENNITIEENISDTCTHYMFNPILVNQNEVYAINVFTKTTLLDQNYGDTIPQGKEDEDMNFMYVDPYNMKNILGESWPEDEKYFKELYAKFLNKMHLKVFMIETYRDHELNSNKRDRVDKIFIKRRILLNDATTESIYLKDLYIPIIDLYKDEYSNELTNDEYEDIVRRILKDLIYDKKSDTWRFSNDYLEKHNIHSLLKYSDSDPVLKEYTFELTFKKNFLKVNDAIWNKININNYDEYTDLYLFRLSKECDYPDSLKYQCTNSDNEIFTNNDILVDPCYTIQPLFTNVFIKNQKASTIYAEYNQSKISFATIGSEKFYRYDSDNTPLMVDISDLDIKHNVIYGGDNTQYYSYSYLNNLYENYDDDETSLSYAYIHNLEPFFNEETGEELFKHLPTFDKLNNCNATVEIAYANEQLLQYYSENSYNYLEHNTITENTYFSENSHSRVDFNKLNTLHIKYNSNGVETVNNVNIYNYTTSIDVDDVKTYYDIHTRYIPNKIEYNDLGIFDEFGISTYTITYSYNSYYSYTTPVVKKVKTNDGIISYDSIIYTNVSGYIPCTGYCTYGLIYINAKFDNTNSSFNLIDRYNNDKKYFTKINGRSIYENDFLFKKDFNEFVPFIKFDLFDTLTTYTKFVVNPFIGNINIYNYPVKNGNRQTYNIISSKKPLCNIALERYFDSITPWITPVTNVNNTYMVKLENNPKHYFKVNKLKDESVLYNEDLNIYTSNGTRVYSDKNNYERVFQVEDKHFNDNYTINLENKISFFIGNNLSYEEVIEAEEKNNVFNLFANHFRKNGDFDDNEILFLYNKYSISYDSYPVGIDYNRVCKIYSLTIIFNLL